MYVVGLEVLNVQSFLLGCDLVLDGCDNFLIWFVVDLVSCLLGIFLVLGVVGCWEGQFSFFNCMFDLFCYCCWVLEILLDVEICVVVGIVGVLIGVIGVLMVLEVIKLICEIGDILDGCIMLFDGLIL